MDIPKRLITMKAQWAKSAATGIPVPPVPGQAYRNAALSAMEIENGQAYDKVFDSARYNEFLHQVSGVMLAVEQSGVLPYADLTDYKEGGLCIALDGALYQAIKASGPGSGGARGTGDAAYWKAVDKDLWAAINALRAAVDALESGGSGGSGGDTDGAYMPQAKAGAGAGQLVPLILPGGSGGSGSVAVVLPAGGSWAYSYAWVGGWGEGASGSQQTGIAAGGTTLYNGVPVFFWGWAWRIA